MRHVMRFALVVGAFAVPAVGCGESFEVTGGGGTNTTTGSGGASGGATSAGGGGSSAGGSGGETGSTGGGTGGCADPKADSDNDGVACEADCDDSNKTVYPGAKELCDGVDNGCEGAGEPPACGGVYVSAANGNDANAGSKAKPVKTLAKGLAIAVDVATAAKGVQVFVAKGAYKESVELLANVSLRGDCAEPTWECGQDKMSYIQGQSEAAVYAGSSVTSTTTLEGFSIQGVPLPENSSSVGVDIRGGGPKIFANVIFSGKVAIDFKSSIGVRVDAEAPTPNLPQIKGNVIVAGDAKFASIGVELRSSLITSLVEGNVITAQKGLFSTGIAVTGAGDGTLLHNNRVQAGTGTIGQFIADQPGSSWGIIVEQGKVEVDGNTINPANGGGSVGNAGTAGCSAPVICGGIAVTSHQVTIWNNVVYGVFASASAGIVLGESKLLPGALDKVVVHSNFVDPVGRPISLDPPEPESVAACFIILTDHEHIARPVGKFRNNICTGGSNAKRYGLLEAGSDGVLTNPEPAAYTNNDLYLTLSGGTSAFSYQDLNNDVITAYGAGMLNPMPNSANNFSTPPLFVDGHLKSFSECANAGTAEDAPPHDIDNQERPMGPAFDVGPDEVK